VSTLANFSVPSRFSPLDYLYRHPQTKIFTEISVTLFFAVGR
jgi:hypothetical protein